MSAVSARNVLDIGLEALIHGEEERRSEFLEMLFFGDLQDEGYEARQSIISENVRVYFEYFESVEADEVDIEPGITLQEASFDVAQKSGVTLWGRLVLEGQTQLRCVIGISAVEMLVQAYCNAQGFDLDFAEEPVIYEEDYGNIPNDFAEFRSVRFEVAKQRIAEITGMISEEVTSSDIERAVVALEEFYPEAMGMFLRTAKGFELRDNLYLEQMDEDVAQEAQSLYERAKIRFAEKNAATGELVSNENEKKEEIAAPDQVEKRNRTDAPLHLPIRNKLEEMPVISPGVKGGQDMKYDEEYVQNSEGNVLEPALRKLETEYPALDKSPASLKWIYREIVDMILREAGA